MLHSKQFVKKTKQGKVLKVVREHYLRDDIWSGSPLDPQCDPSAHKLSADAAAYLIIDTNIALHQMDLLEHSAVADVVVPSVVLEEVRARNTSAYQRLRQLIAAEHKRFFVFANEHHRETFVKQEPGESPNDRNDRAIRVAAAWYTSRLAGKKRVLLLTDDADSRRKAGEAGVEALGSLAYARSRAKEAPELQDLVGAAAAAAAAANGGGGESAAAGAMVGGSEAAAAAAGGTGRGKPAKRSRIYEEHKPMSEITAGIKAGRYQAGGRAAESSRLPACSPAHLSWSGCPGSFSKSDCSPECACSTTRASRSRSSTSLALEKGTPCCCPAIASALTDDQSRFMSSRCSHEGDAFSQGRRSFRAMQLALTLWLFCIERNGRVYNRE